MQFTHSLSHKGPAIYGGTRGELEGSLTQRRLLTASLVSTGSSLMMPNIPYFTKEEDIYESIPPVKKPPIPTNEVAICHPSLKRRATSDLKVQIILLQTSQEIYYSKLATSSTEYSLVLEQVNSIVTNLCSVKVTNLITGNEGGEI